MEALPECRVLVGGEWVAGAETSEVLDKYRLTPCWKLHRAGREQVRQAVQHAHAAFESSVLSPFERGAILDRAAAQIEQRAGEIVAAMQREAGFTQSDAQGELKRTVQTFQLSAEEARRLAGDVIPLAGAPQQEGRFGFTIRVPLGVVCAITPFNAPLNTVAHKVAPALAAGNAVVLKPSSHTPRTANLMAECLLAAGLPPGLLAVVHGGAQVVQWLLDEPLVRFYAFTGSTEVGRDIHARAGLRRTQMELGSIAFTVLAEDADLDKALPKVVNAGYRKAGQVCTSVQVLLVQQALRERVEERLGALVRALPFGDPAKADTVVGPVISEAAAERIEAWIAQAMALGARRLAGGERRGAVIPPTLLSGISPAMNVSCQEIFGPVVCIEPFAKVDEAIARINGTPYGLATGIFTNKLDDAFRLARKLVVGGVHINETSSSRVDMMPYGGSKDSGFGREGPHYAVREMTEERMVTITA
ncbi:aldehyde dehydrogenase family protein [Ramlibacter sp. G-1-2-2]|uniref:Aldehyde dehydrogenase family protein n=1 Tax=Ramlibacter agri TaxID=2728837 RepID=A0A848GVR7_9BURK|nr:aldehyde dehydrogenase family protein [Ramlibacter agri]NML42217.1 aldehyde dehydrogenase family protein [Ramlibacter agri]